MKRVLFFLALISSSCLIGDLYIRNEFGTNDSVSVFGNTAPSPSVSAFRLYGMGQYAWPLNRVYPDSKRRMGELYLGAGYNFSCLKTVLLAGWEHSPYENSFFRIVPGFSFCSKFGELQAFGYIPVSEKKREVQQYGVDGFYQYAFSRCIFRLGGFGYFGRKEVSSYGGVGGALIVPVCSYGVFETRHEWDPVFGYLAQVGISLSFCKRYNEIEPTLWFRTRLNDR